MELTKDSPINSWNNLPIELCITIFEYLPGSVAATCTRVCKKWQKLLILDRYWKTQLEKIDMLVEYQLSRANNPYLSQFREIFQGRSVQLTPKEAYLVWIGKMKIQWKTPII